MGAVPRSIKDLIISNDVNLSGFLNMLVAARDHKVKRFVFAASSSTYGDSESMPKVEDIIGKPLSPYAITKYVNELYADIFSKTYGLETISHRYFNVFGRKQDPNGAYAAVIPKFVSQLMKGEAPVINGDGNYSRDFTPIDNIIQANVLSLITTNEKAINAVYNVAFGDRNTLNDLMRYLKEYLSELDTAVADVNVIYGLNRAGDIPHSHASIQKAKNKKQFKVQSSIFTATRLERGYWLVLEKFIKMKKNKIAIIGLGYVGLPLARLFATKYAVVGFDINKERVAALTTGVDSTLEVSDTALQEVLLPESTDAKGLFCTTELADIKDCNYYIITVPTPVDKNNRPVLTPLIKASETVGTVLQKDDTVIYESTVYPGATEEECIPVLENVSGLVFNKHFYAGYSPERINPGDKKHTVEKILKVTSGSTLDTGKKVDALYKSVITAGTHLAPTIKVAEASKVIENSQRDINIAFVNELAKIFNLMDINTNDVLEAAGTKWNFLPFKPGLVGGHCIGVDPYYLAQKAQEYGYNPEIILAGRRLNDSMGEYVASEVIKLMIAKDVRIKNAEILILGITFKENCPDVRNTKAVDVVAALKGYTTNITIYDPWASEEEVLHEYGIKSVKILPKTKFDVIVLTVAHNEFKDLDFSLLLKDRSIVYDVKNILSNSITDKRL